MPDAPTLTGLAAALTKPPTKRAMPYKIDGAAAPVVGGGVIGRGHNVKQRATDAESAAFIIFERDPNQQALSETAVGAAIYHGVISRAEIMQLWSMADAAIASQGSDVVGGADDETADETAAPDQGAE